MGWTLTRSWATFKEIGKKNWGMGSHTSLAVLEESLLFQSWYLYYLDFSPLCNIPGLPPSPLPYSFRVGVLTRLLCAVLCLVALLSPNLHPHGLKPAKLLCPWGFSRQEYWSGLPCPPPGDLPSPGIKHRPPAQAGSSHPLLLGQAQLFHPEALAGLQD